MLCISVIFFGNVVNKFNPRTAGGLSHLRTAVGTAVGVGVGPESVVLTEVGVGVGVGKFASTPTPARSRSRLQDFFIISLLVKMEIEIETEHFVLTAEVQTADGLSCTCLLSLGLRLLPGELAFSHTHKSSR